MPIDFSPITNMQPVNLAQIYGAADQANAQRIHNQYLGMQMQKAQKELADEEALKGAYAQSISPEGTLDRKTLFANLYKTNPMKALEAQKAFNEQDIAQSKSKREDTKSQLDNAASILKLQGDSAKSVLANPTLDTAIYTTKRFGELTGQDVTGELQNIQAIGDNPDALRKWAGGHALSAEQMLGKLQNINTGQFNVQQMVEPLTGKVVETGRTQMQATPDAVMSNERAIKEGALNRGVTMRGQNLTDARSREKNSIDKLEKGTYDSERGVIVDTRTGIARPVTQEGTPFTAKLPEAQQRQIVGTKNLKNAINEYTSQLDNWKAMDTLSPDARAAMGVKYNNMMLQAKEAYNLGVINGPDLEILTSVVTDPRSLTGAITSNKALKSQADELNRIMGDVGGTSADKVRGNDKPYEVNQIIPNNSKMPNKVSGKIAVPIKSDNDYNKLPSGTRFVAPDGTTRIKP